MSIARGADLRCTLTSHVMALLFSIFAGACAVLPAPIRLQFTVVAAAGWPEVVARPVRGWEVVLESRQPFTGTVHLEAYQGDAVE